MAEAKTKKKGLALHWQILIGIGLGIVAGIVLCKITPYDNWYKYIKWAGDIFLRGLRMIVIPLVFSSIALGVAGMGNSAALGRIAGKTILYYIVTTAIAATIGLTLVNIVSRAWAPALTWRRKSRRSVRAKCHSSTRSSRSSRRTSSSRWPRATCSRSSSSPSSSACS